MSKLVVDSSVLLAFINKEIGSELAGKLLKDSVMSSVNVAECAAILTARHNIPIKEVRFIIDKLIGNIITYNEEHAYITAELEIINKERKYGLSLGDKACLALGKYLGISVYTADKIWSDIEINGIDVKLIR